MLRTSLSNTPQMKTYFYLSRKRTNAKGKAPVYCRIEISSDNRSDYSTGIFIFPSDWDKKESFVKQSLPFEHTQLLLKQQKAQAAILKAEVNGMDCAKEIADMAQGKKKKVYRWINQVLPDFFDYIGASQRTKTDIERVVSEFRLLIPVTLQNLDINTPIQYEKYQKQFGWLNSTIYRKQCTLQRILEYCMNMGYISLNPYRLYKPLTVKRKEKIAISLAQRHELQKKIFSQVRLNNVKHLLLRQCFTGFAYADLKNYRNHEIKTINNIKYIIGQRIKTGKTFYIPVLPEMEQLMNDEPNPHVMTNQKYNSYLKEIADIMEWNFVLTSHVGRKTFAQIMLNKGVSWEAIASMLGHERTTMTEKHYATLGFERVEFELLRIFEPQKIAA